MKKMLTIVWLISACVHLNLPAGVNDLLEKEAMGRYTQCQEDYELALVLQYATLEEKHARVYQDLKQSRELTSRVPTQFIFQSKEISAEQSREAGANYKQQLILERESLKFVIRALDGAILSKKAALNYPEMEPQDIKYLNTEIGHLKHHRSIAENLSKALDREINR